MVITMMNLDEVDKSNGQRVSFVASDQLEEDENNLDKTSMNFSSDEELLIDKFNNNLAFDKLARIGKGDQQAFKELYFDYSKYIYSFIRKLIYVKYPFIKKSVYGKWSGEEEFIEELVNETFSRVWKRPGNFQGNSKFSTWLSAVAHHVLLDEVRKFIRKEKSGENKNSKQKNNGKGRNNDKEENNKERIAIEFVSITGLESDIMESIAVDDGKHALDYVIEIEREKALRECINKLPQKYFVMYEGVEQTLIDLAYKKDKSSREVGEIINRPAGTVRYLLSAGCEMIKNCMASAGMNSKSFS